LQRARQRTFAALAHHPQVLGLVQGLRLLLLLLLGLLHHDHILIRVDKGAQAVRRGPGGALALGLPLRSLLLLRVAEGEVHNV
jgi:hypothetical protein